MWSISLIWIRSWLIHEAGESELPAVEADIQSDVGASSSATTEPPIQEWWSAEEPSDSESLVAAGESGDQVLVDVDADETTEAAETADAAETAERCRVDQRSQKLDEQNRTGDD